MHCPICSSEWQESGIDERIGYGVCPSCRIPQEKSLLRKAITGIFSDNAHYLSAREIDEDYTNQCVDVVLQLIRERINIHRRPLLNKVEEYLKDTHEQRISINCVIDELIKEFK